jgi:hypothetical protein
MRVIVSILITTIWCAVAAAQESGTRIDQPATPQAGYRAFLEAVRSENAQAIKAAMVSSPDESPEFMKLVVDQLIVFRQFDRVAHQKLGDAVGDLGFDLNDAAIDRRLAALKGASFDGSRLTLRRPDPMRYSPFVGGGADVIMGAEPARPAGIVWPGGGGADAGTHAAPKVWKPDALLTYGGTAAGYVAASKAPGSQPGTQILAVYREATKELEAGRITDRAALDRFLERGLARFERDFDKRIDGVFTTADETETVQARGTVARWLTARRKGDIESMKDLTAAGEPDDVGAVERAVQQTVVQNELDRAAGKIGLRRVRPDLAPLIDQSLTRIPTARLYIHKENNKNHGILRTTTYNRVVATTRPWVQAGFRGPPPESFVMVRWNGQWKLALEVLTKDASRPYLSNSPRAYMERQWAEAGDVELAECRAMLDMIKRGVIRTPAQFLDSISGSKQRIDAAIETRRLQAQQARAKRLEEWRTSPAGRTAIGLMTAPKSRLQFRLVLEGDAPGEFDLLNDPQSGRMRVSREILLNEAAFASASVAPSLTDRTPTVQATLTDAGANQMEWVTSRNINHRLAIVFEGKVVAAPTIRATIRQALVIDGGPHAFTADEADQIVSAIRAGK